MSCQWENLMMYGCWKPVDRCPLLTSWANAADIRGQKRLKAGTQLGMLDMTAVVHGRVSCMVKAPSRHPLNHMSCCCRVRNLELRSTLGYLGFTAGVRADEVHSKLRRSRIGNLASEGCAAGSSTLHHPLLRRDISVPYQSQLFWTRWSQASA